MKHIGNEIDSILAQRKIKKKDFAKKIEMTDVNLSKVLKKASIDSLLLEKIANALSISASYFFDKQDQCSYTEIGHRVFGTGNKIAGNISLPNCIADLEKAHMEIGFLKKELASQKLLTEEKERLITIITQK